MRHQQLPDCLCLSNAIAVTESLYTLTVARGGDGTGTVIYNQAEFSAAIPALPTSSPTSRSPCWRCREPTQVFTAWLDCDSTVSDQCTVSMNRNRTATAMFQGCAHGCGRQRPADPLRSRDDGVLVLRYLLGLRGVSLVNNARAGGATRDAAQIAAHLDARIAAMDIDGDGAVRATSDGCSFCATCWALRGNVLIDRVNRHVDSDAN